MVEDTAGAQMVPKWDEVGPVLLAALKGLVSAYCDTTWGTAYAMERALPNARSALARATGAEP